MTNNLPIGEVDRGATSGVTVPNGGGTFVYGFNSLQVVAGAAALFANQVNFAPAAKGGSVRGAVKRGLSGGNTGFSPFLFIGGQGPAVEDNGYLLGLGDGDPYHIVLKKGRIVDGVPDLAPSPATNGVLMRSVATFTPDAWHHLRLDMIVQGTGDVLLQVFQSDLETNAVTAPVWAQIPGMEGPLSPTIDGFVDDALQVNTGAAPFTSGRIGFGMQAADTTRRGFFDQIEVARQL